jgi:hypothetical protein
MLTTIEEIRAEAARIAPLLRESGGERAAATGGGSAGRGLPEELRAAVIAVRAALFRRGFYDPLLVRFDSATVAPATNAEIAQRLGVIAESLR